MTNTISGDELAALIQNVFHPRHDDRALAIMVDLPDAAVPDSEPWRQRRELAEEWMNSLAPLRDSLGLDLRLCVYRNARANNAELPERAWLLDAPPIPSKTEDLDPAGSVPFSRIFQDHSILIALTEFSATAPLKLAARSFPIRAATMPGFEPAMIPALRLDYEEINRRVCRLKGILDWAERAELDFEAAGARHSLVLDLRHRTGHASGGLIREPGTAGNLPSGEAYIVPYEGEIEGEPSMSAGELPVQFGDEVVLYEIRGNRALRTYGTGAAALAEAERLAREPAYGNLAELGIGVLSAFGVQPCGSLLLDEKLGLHIAFGRSDHFGGRVGPRDFSVPEAVVHIDRVYLPSVQPRVRVRRVDLYGPAGEVTALIRDDLFVIRF